MANITFVDDQDNVIGAGPIEEAHEHGIRHRVVRIFLLNDDRQLLMQRRAEHIFSNPGKWAESAAGHVDQGETYEAAAYRELHEELGVDELPLTEVGYYFSEEAGPFQTAKRFNRIYTGTFNGEVHLNLEEVSEVKWMSLPELDEWMATNSDAITEGCVKAFRYIRKLL